MGSSPGQIKDKIMGFDVSPLRMQHSGERATTGWLGIGIMFPSRATCLDSDCCLSELVPLG